MTLEEIKMKREELDKEEENFKISKKIRLLKEYSSRKNNLIKYEEKIQKEVDELNTLLDDYKKDYNNDRPMHLVLKFIDVE